MSPERFMLETRVQRLLLAHQESGRETVLADVGDGQGLQEQEIGLWLDGLVEASDAELTALESALLTTVPPPVAEDGGWSLPWDAPAEVLAEVISRAQEGSRVGLLPPVGAAREIRAHLDRVARALSAIRLPLVDASAAAEWWPERPEESDGIPRGVRTRVQLKGARLYVDRSAPSAWAPPGTITTKIPARTETVEEGEAGPLLEAALQRAQSVLPAQAPWRLRWDQKEARLHAFDAMITLFCEEEEYSEEVNAPLREINALVLRAALQGLLVRRSW